MTAILEGLDEDFRHRFALAVTAIRAELGISVSIVSAFRTRAKQQALYDGYQNKLKYPGDPRYKDFNYAAKPGSSNHERGLAIDISPDSTPAMRSVFARYGLHFPVPGEPWHVEPRSARGLSMPPLSAPIPVVPPEDDEMHVLFLLDAGGVNKGEPRDWIVPPNGPKFSTPHKGYLDALRKAGAKTVDLTGQPEASRDFRENHP